MIIVTGSSGFIGSNLIESLLKYHEKILAVDYVYRDYISHPLISFLQAEAFYDNLEYFCNKAYYIFHEGAISSTAETDRRKLFEKNIKPSCKLINYCYKQNIPLQYASSASVYGNLPVEKWVLEEKPLNPLNEYAKSKTKIDKFLLNLSKIKEPFLIQGMRYFNVYGKNENHKLGQSSPHFSFNKEFIETGKITLFEGSKNFRRDFIPIELLINIKLNAMFNKQSGIFDLGTGNPTSFYEVALEICKEEQYINWIPIPDSLKNHYQTYSCANMNWLFPTQ